MPCPPQVVNFGKLISSSSGTQYFSVSNPLHQPIHVVVDANSHSQLKGSTNTSQVVPPGRLTPEQLHCLLHLQHYALSPLVACCWASIPMFSRAQIHKSEHALATADT
jgi:hypothetical protein